MDQLHNRLTDEQVKILLQGYCQGKMKGNEVQKMLGVSKSLFFILLKEYRQDPENFSIAYERSTPGKLSTEVEAEIEKALMEEKEIAEDPDSELWLTFALLRGLLACVSFRPRKG